MRLELGVNTCFAVKRWPSPADWAPIVRNRLGLTLVEHSLDLVDLGAGVEAEAEAAAVVSAASEFGLEVRSVFTGLAGYSSNLLLHPSASARERAEGYFERAIAFSGRVGATAIGGHVGAFSVGEWDDPYARNERWAGLQAALGRLATVASRHGQDAIMVENLAAAREPSTMAMIRDILADPAPDRAAVRLALDVGHMCVPGTVGADRDPYAWLRQLGSAAHEIQLQQSDDAGDHHWPFTPAANERGRIDADHVIDALGEAGVESIAMILEVIPPFEQEDGSVLDDMAASVDYWRDALARRGVAAS